MTAQCKEKERKKIWIHEKKNNDWKKKSILWKPDQIKKELPSPYTPTTTT